MEFVLLFVGAVIGAAASLAISRHYYRRSLSDAADSAMALRLDKCEEGDRTFLVALLQASTPIPRYALINVEFETKGGRTAQWASNTSTMIRSVNARAGHSLQCHGGSAVDEDRQTVSLSNRGRDNAAYLERTEYPKARFTVIDDSDAQRLGMFRSEHGRDPRKGKIGDSGVMSTYTSGG